MQKKALALRNVKFAPPTDDTTEARSFEGYGAVFGNIDSYDDIIAPGAFAASIAEHKAAGTMPVMLWNHDAMAMPIGVWTDLFEDEHGLKMSGRFLGTAAGRDAYTIAKAGAVTGLSIGYIVTASEIEKRDGKTVRIITEVKLIEVSLVTFPANDLARVDDVKSQHLENEEDMKLQRKSLERLAELFGEAKDLIDGLATEADDEKSEVDDQADDDESVGSEENSSDDAVSEDEAEVPSDEEIEGEAKYNLTARMEAVRNLTLAVKNLENHGR